MEKIYLHLRDVISIIIIYIISQSIFTDHQIIVFEDSALNIFKLHAIFKKKLFMGKYHSQKLVFD